MVVAKPELLPVSSSAHLYLLSEFFFKWTISDSFDIAVNVTIVRSHSKKITIKEDYYKRFIGKDLAFDFIDYGSLNSYNLSFRVVRFPLSDNTYECIVTNLPTNEFSTEEIKELS